jgi:integrase
MKLSETWNNNEEKMLFKPEDRKYVDRVNVNTELKRLLKRHFGIEDITTHSLRHTYGTRCIEAGMAPVVVQKLMGHTDVSVTLNTYTSVFDKFKEKEIEKVNKYYMEENMLNAVKLLQEDSYNKFYDLEDTKEL